MIKILFSLLFLFICIFGYSQAQLYSKNEIVTLANDWINILNNNYQIRYQNETIVVPMGSGAYLNENSHVKVIHFPVIKGKDVKKIKIGQNEYSINGIAFYDNGTIQSLWLNESYFISTKQGSDPIINWPIAISFCFIEPFGMGSINYDEEGKIKSIQLNGVTNFNYQNNTYKIKSVVMFNKIGGVSSIRFEEPITFNTPVGIKIVASTGFYEDASIKFITIQNDEIETLYGKIKISKSIDFYKDGKIFVTFLNSPISISGKIYNNIWIGFTPEGKLIGEMELDDSGDNWIPK